MNASVRWRRNGLAALGLLLAVSIGALLAHRGSPKHLLTVEPGVLYRSGALPLDQLQEVVERYGIRTAVNLRSELENAKGDWHERQAQLLERLGVRLLDLPMHTGYPPDERALAAWVALFDEPERLPVLVHCEYGVVRTGMMVAVYQMEFSRRSGEQAWADFELFGGELEEPIRSRVSEFIRSYRVRPSRLSPPAGHVPGGARRAS